MNLSQIIAHKMCLTLNVVATDLELSREIVLSLIALEYLDFGCCGLFSDDCNCGKALSQFQLSYGLPRGVVDARMAEALLEI